MKKLLLLFIFIGSTLALNAQEVSDQQWTMITKKTADWCPFCGQWGWTFKNNVLEDTQDMPVVFWMAHHSGGLETPTSSAIVQNIPSSGQPVFFINTDNMGVFGSNINAKREEFKILIESLSGFEPFAGVGSTAIFDGEKITTTAKAQFFVDLEGGEYWLSSYLVDDIRVAFQSSQGNNAEHENILLHSFNGDQYFGMKVSEGAVSANQEFIVEGGLDFTGDNNIPDYTDGYSVVTVLWSRVDGQYVPFNMNRQPITGATSTKNLLESVDITAFHSGAGQLDLGITSDVEIKNAVINLFDISGKSIATESNVSIKEGANSIMLQTRELSTGTYIVNIQSNIGSRSIKVSVR